MKMSPLRIFTLNRHSGFVHTQALNWMDAPWLPKSLSGTSSPAPHLRHRGNSYSTLLAPFPLLWRTPRPFFDPKPTEPILARIMPTCEVVKGRVKKSPLRHCQGRVIRRARQIIPPRYYQACHIPAPPILPFWPGAPRFQRLTPPYGCNWFSAKWAMVVFSQPCACLVYAPPRQTHTERTSLCHL